MDGGPGPSERVESSRPDSPIGDDEDAVLDDLPEDTGGGPRKRKGKSTRWNIPTTALGMLEQVFAKDKFPSVETRKKIAADLKVTPRQVQVWFQNKRQRSTKPPGRPTDARNMLQTSVSSTRPRPAAVPRGSAASPRPPAPAMRSPPSLRLCARRPLDDRGGRPAPLGPRARASGRRRPRLCTLVYPALCARAPFAPERVPTRASLPALSQDDIQSALMNFGMTCGFGPNSSVDPTLMQLEVFANEETGPGCLPSSLAQAALLNFGGMGAGCGFSPNSSIDTAATHSIDGFGSRDDAPGFGRHPGATNPHLAKACATEAWMAAAAAQMANLAAANSLANAAAEGKLTDAAMGGLLGGSMPSVGAPAAGHPFGSSPWGLLQSGFGGSASASLLNGFQSPAALNQLLGGVGPRPAANGSGGGEDNGFASSYGVKKEDGAAEVDGAEDGSDDAAVKAEAGGGGGSSAGTPTAGLSPAASVLDLTGLPALPRVGGGAAALAVLQGTGGLPLAAVSGAGYPMQRSTSEMSSTADLGHQLSQLPSISNAPTAPSPLTAPTQPAQQPQPQRLAASEAEQKDQQPRAADVAEAASGSSETTASPNGDGAVKEEEEEDDDKREDKAAAADKSGSSGGDASPSADAASAAAEAAPSAAPAATATWSDAADGGGGAAGATAAPTSAAAGAVSQGVLHNGAANGGAQAGGVAAGPSSAAQMAGLTAGAGSALMGSANEQTRLMLIKHYQAMLMMQQQQQHIQQQQLQAHQIQQQRQAQQQQQQQQWEM